MGSKKIITKQAGNLKAIFKKNQVFEMNNVYKRHTNWIIYFLHNDKKLSNQTDLTPVSTKMISKLQG